MGILYTRVCVEGERGEGGGERDQNKILLASSGIGSYFTVNDNISGVKGKRERNRN